MDTQELENKIKKLEQRISSIERISNEPVLSQNLDIFSKRVIENVVAERIFDVVWEDYTYFSTLFEGNLRFTTAALGAEQTVNSGGIYLETTASSGNEADLYFENNSSKVFVANKETRFRVVTKVSSVSNIIFSITTLSATGYCGFKIENSTLTGVSEDGTTEETVTLGTVSADTWYELELRFYPGEKVIFYVDQVEKGTLSTRLPTGTGAIRILDTILSTTAAAAKNARIESLELMQKK